MMMPFRKVFVDDDAGKMWSVCQLLLTITMETCD